MRPAVIKRQDDRMLERQRLLRAAADVVAGAFAGFAEVTAAAVIGSVSRPLRKEVPRFRDFARAGVEVWHECADLDVALWLDSLGRLGELRRARDRALLDAGLGVANHEVDVFLFEPGSDRYLGRLCHFATCSKQGKHECLVPGCGAIPFCRHIDGFRPHRDLLAAAADAMLYRRGEGRIRSALDLPATTGAAP